MNDNRTDEAGGSDDPHETKTISAEAVPNGSEPGEGEETSAEPWSPATDAGVRGNDPDETPKIRKPPTSARGGDAPLRRRVEPARRAKPAADAAEDAEIPEGDRIAKAIARAGIASRRDVEAMIEQGRVTLNGVVLDSPAINVTAEDRITVDGEMLPARERTRLWIFHKPRGLVTTARDPEGRQTVFEALPEDLPRVVAIGRLDINTEGLLLLTNDGGLAKVIAHPDTGWLRRYRVRAHGDTTQGELDKLRKGVTIDGMDYGPVDAVLDRASGDNLWLTLGLREGKNREVKRILEHLGLAVNRLIRLSFGPFQLGDLEVGLVEEVRTKVLKEQLGPALSSQAGVDFESPVREPIAAFGSPKQQAKQPARSASAARSPERRRDEDAPRPARSFADRGPLRGSDRPMQRPPAPVRVATGGTGSSPRRSVWRSEEPLAEDGPRRVKVPRRGADPKVEREAAAERGRERVGAIQTGERRVLVERLKASPQEAAEPHRRSRGRDDERAPRSDRADAPPARARSGDARPFNRENGGARPFDKRQGEARPSDKREGAGRPSAPREGGVRPFTPREGGARPFDRDAGGGRSFSQKPGGARSGPRSEAEARPARRTDGASRPPRREDGPPRGDAERPRSFKPGPSRTDAGGYKGRAERPGSERGEGRGDKPADGGFRGGERPTGDSRGFKGGPKPGGAKPGGTKSAGGRGGAERASGADRSGFKAGGKPGGGKPGGGKPGGFKSGGFGGRSGKPGGGSARPPRGGPR